MGPSAKIILMLCLAGFAYSASAVDHQVSTLAGIDRNNFRCEELPSGHCAFAVSSSGSRCVLETNVLRNGEVELECQSSDVVTNKFSSWIESSSCINACGLNHMSVGLSTDFLVEKELQRSICASSCIDVCSNIEELFTMLAGGEGVRLRTLCDAYKPDPVVAAVDETTNETASFDGETATVGVAADAEAAISTATDSSSATIVPTPRKLIQTTVTYADAPAAAYVWTADRRMLYNLAPAPAVVPVPLSAPASSPVYTNNPAAPAAVADAPVAAVPVSVTRVPAVAAAPVSVVPAAAPAPAYVSVVVEVPAPARGSAETVAAPASTPAFGDDVAVPAPAPSSV